MWPMLEICSTPAVWRRTENGGQRNTETHGQTGSLADYGLGVKTNKGIRGKYITFMFGGVCGAYPQVDNVWIKSMWIYIF